MVTEHHDSDRICLKEIQVEGICFEHSRDHSSFDDVGPTASMLFLVSAEE